MSAKVSIPKNPKLTDEERHKRFLDMAQKVEAIDDRDAFDKAFAKVAKPTPQGAYSKNSRHKDGS